MPPAEGGGGQGARVPLHRGLHDVGLRHSRGAVRTAALRMGPGRPRGRQMARRRRPPRQGHRASSGAAATAGRPCRRAPRLIWHRGQASASDAALA